MRRSILVLSVLIFAGLAWSQQCPQAPVLAPSHDLNLFTEEQEVDFGNIIADQLLGTMYVIEDEEVSAHLQAIVKRLLKQMPATRLQFQAYVLDAPYNNAFTIPGGRMFFTRKMVAFARSEDELAGVVAHEMGHQVTHQLAQRWSRIFREVAEASKLGDRADIEEKYQKVLDIARTKQGVFRADIDKEQAGADQVAVYALARAGYDPQAVVAFWDRFAETKGKKGSWFSDVFGSTWPESKRLREFAKNVGALPPACVEAAGRQTATDYETWQTVVKNYSGFGKKEDLRNLARRVRLQPPLRGDINHLRFSPDGAYILAQDDASIFVLTREPLAPVFRIDAIDAHPAMFSPDSKSVVFYTSGLRVERWSIAEKRLQDVNDVHLFRGCAQSELSPDGSLLACVTPNRDTYFPLELSLIDVTSAEPVITKKNFVGPQVVGENTFLNYLILHGSHRPVMAMAFSPDGRYFLAGRKEAHFMYDLTARAEVDMRGELKKFTSYTFAFVGPDRILGKNDDRGERGSIVRVPSGEVVASDIPIGPLDIHPITSGEYAVLGPLPQAPIGIMDLKTRKIFMASKSEAIDFYGTSFVQERTNGELGLYAQPGLKPSATVALPLGPLASLHAAALSPDLRLAAMSDRTRGAVWDLEAGQRLAYVRGFRGALFGDRALYAEFAPANLYSSNITMKGEKEKEVRKREAEKPGESVAKIDLATRGITELASFQRRQDLYQAGSVLLVMTPADDDDPEKNVALEARDLRTGSVLWSRKFSKWTGSLYGNNVDETAVLFWYLGSSGAKEELKGDPDVKKLVDAIKDSEGSYLVEVLDARTGKPIGKFPLETGRASFRLRSGYAGAGKVVLTDNNNRVLLYSYKGEKLGRTFGRRPALSPQGGWLCVEREPGRLALLDAKSMQKRGQYTFSQRIVFSDFTDEKHLAVVTADQTLFVLDVSADAAPPARAAGSGTP